METPEQSPQKTNLAADLFWFLALVITAYVFMWLCQ